MGKTNPYFKAISGLKKSLILNQSSSHLILTTSPTTAYGLNEKELFNLLQRNFQLLRTRLERYYNIQIKAYFRVTTNEGYGVIHAIIISQFIPRDIIVNEWNEIHGSQIVSIQSINHNQRDHGHVSHYFTSQYLSNQQKATFVRYGMSKEYLFKGAVSEWNKIKKSCRIESTARCNEWGYITYKIDLEKALNLWNVRLSQICEIWLMPDNRKTVPIKPILHRKIANKKKYQHLVNFYSKPINDKILTNRGVNSEIKCTTYV